MEPQTATWLTEIARQGFGYVLFLASLLVLWKKDQEIQIFIKEARDNERKMVVAMEEAASAISETNDVTRSRIETDKVNAAVIQALVKQIDTSNQALVKQIDISERGAQERAKHIVDRVQDSVRLLGGNNTRGP